MKAELVTAHHALESIEETASTAWLAVSRVVAEIRERARELSAGKPDAREALVCLVLPIAISRETKPGNRLAAIRTLMALLAIDMPNARTVRISGVQIPSGVQLSNAENVENEP